MTILDQTAAPAAAQAGPLRRSLRLEQQLTEAHQSHAQVLLTGSGVNDFLITEREQARRLTAFLHGYCEQRHIGYVRYSMADGVSSYRTLPGDQAVAVRGADADMYPAQVVRQVLADLRAAATLAMFAFDYADGVLGPGPDQMSLQVSVLCEQLQALTADTAWHKAGLRLVLIDRGGGVTARLVGQPGIRTIHVGPPDQAELTIFAQRAARAAATSRLFLSPGLSEEETGRRARGLLNLHLHEMRLASSQERPVTPQQIADFKATAIRDTSGGTLELMPSRVTFAADVAGLPAVRLALDDAQRAGRTTLRILLAGPPGTGKTLAATAIAAALNVPAVRYGEILNEYVGVAERNIARANQILRAMAPLVLFIDEANQVGLGARGNMARSSEVYQNLRASLFEFLGDTGEQTGITVVATTNVPMQLDDAALSRFAVLPVLFASAADLVQIMAIHARRLGIALDDRGLIQVMTDYTTVAGGVLSGRSAVQLLEAAHVQALRASSPTVTAQHVRGTLNGWIASDWTPAAEYSTLSSLLSARHADAWPWVAASRLGERYDLPAYLHPYQTDMGEVDVGHMRSRLAELGGDHAFSGHG